MPDTLSFHVLVNISKTPQANYMGFFALIMFGFADGQIYTELAPHSVVYTFDRPGQSNRLPTRM